MRRPLTISLLLGAAVLMGAALIVWLLLPGVRVTIANVGDQPIHDVVVHVTGRDYALGDLAAGQSRTVRVIPTSESGVEVSCKDSTQRSRRMELSTYVESGYQGVIEVRTKDGRIVDYKVRIRSFFLY